MDCPAPGQQFHNYQPFSHDQEYYDNSHWGGWGGFLKGHKCCGRCKGNLDGRCHGDCNNQCGNPQKKLRTITTIICTHCGQSPP
jgi:hypothetical protein